MFDFNAAIKPARESLREVILSKTALILLSCMLGQVVNASTPYVISLKENSVLAYRYAEKYYVTYTRQAGVFLQKNVFTGKQFVWF